MRNISTSLLPLALSLSCLTAILQGEIEVKEEVLPPRKEKVKQISPVVSSKFIPFTGKITKNKVRMRLQASYEGSVMKELTPNEYVIVLGENEDFYAVQPPADIKGYVFRSYVLDNVVEADRVNVRQKPDKEATIISQLKAGDRVEGTPASSNNKWLEIKLPSTTRFYIAKEYVEKVGDVSFKDRFDKKQQAAYGLLRTTDEMSLAELQKPFDQMSITGIKANYQHIINDYPEFPDAVAKAKESLGAIQDGYNAKKMAYLEEQSRLTSSTAEANKRLNAELQIQRNKISHLEHQIEQERQLVTAVQPMIEGPNNSKKPGQLPVNMSAWLPIEERLFNIWAQQTGRYHPQEFYDEQLQQSIVLTGIIDPYNRSVKNKPGDYMLLNPSSKLPVAFLYSTHINLQEYVGHEVAIHVSPRDNSNFAFPAYFVLSVD